MNSLRVLAGPEAYQRIKQNGLTPDAVDAVFGASGAAKWLAIQGLDKAIFGQWIHKRSKDLHLFGTSIGAWKLAAAASAKPEVAMDQLAEAYIAQRYSKQTRPEDVAAEAERILNAFLHAEDIEAILQTAKVHLHIGTIRSKGLLASDRRAHLALAMLQLAMKNVGGRNALRQSIERVLFSTSPDQFPLFRGDGYKTLRFPLNRSNTKKALLASGSIPYVLPAVRDIPGAEPGSYRDGGMLDYHPVPSNFSRFEGLILYPHFYPHLIPGWFDKTYKKRRATGSIVNNVVVLTPSEDFVARLPYQRIPDRKDFKRFLGRDDERERVWRAGLAASQELGEDFLEAVRNGDIASRLERL